MLMCGTQSGHGIQFEGEGIAHPWTRDLHAGFNKTKGCRLRLLTVWIIFVHAYDAFLVAGHDGHLTFSEEKLRARDANSIKVLGKDDQLVRILLFITVSERRAQEPQE